MRKILIFTPYAGRTGSEMFLWYMLKNINPSKYKIMLVSDCAGELLKEMPKHINTKVTLKYQSKLERLKSAILGFMGINAYERQIIKIHNEFKPDFWYLNTVLMTDKISIAKKVNAKVITHIHELMTDYSLVSKNQLKSAIDYSKLCIADSKAVYSSLELLGAKNISLQYECIDHSLINVDEAKTQLLKAELDLGKYKFVWLMSGTSSLRKGTDMICELATLLQNENMAIIWLGHNPTSGMDYYIEKYIEKNNLKNVFFLGKKTIDYYSYMALMDGFVLMSREEPFGMVVTEALALGKPVVTFNAGGVREILTNETGVVCDSWNVYDLVKSMKKVAENSEQYKEVDCKSRAMEFDVTKQIHNWEKIIYSA